MTSPIDPKEAAIPSATRISPYECYCTEPGCGFQAPPRALLDHLVAVHSLRAARITYGDQYQLVVPASERRVLLIAEKDERVFLLAVGDADEGTAPARRPGPALAPELLVARM